MDEICDVYESTILTEESEGVKKRMHFFNVTFHTVKLKRQFNQK